MTKSEILSFIDAQTSLMLTTMNGAQPETRAMINIRNKDIAPHLIPYFNDSDKIFFITNPHTDKVAQIRANKVANVYAYDNNLNGLLLTGEIKEITEKVTMNALWDDSWKKWYPKGRDGGEFSLLEFIPKHFKQYEHKEEGFVITQGTITEELHITSKKTINLLDTI